MVWRNMLIKDVNRPSVKNGVVESVCSVGVAEITSGQLLEHKKVLDNA